MTRIGLCDWTAYLGDLHLNLAFEIRDENMRAGFPRDLRINRIVCANRFEQRDRARVKQTDLMRRVHDLQRDAETHVLEMSHLGKD